jgi:hypothetical protein
MNTIARITAIILIILGILVMLGGVATGIIGAVRSGQRATSAAPTRPAAGLGGLLTGLGLAIFLFVQGMIVIATGEGLYLLADLAHKMPSA